MYSVRLILPIKLETVGVIKFDVYLKSISVLADKTRIIPTKQRSNFVIMNFCFVGCICIKNFKTVTFRQRLIYS